MNTLSQPHVRRYLVTILMTQKQNMKRPFSSVFHKTSEAQLSMVPRYGETKKSAQMEVTETVEGSNQGSMKFGNWPKRCQKRTDGASTSTTTRQARTHSMQCIRVHVFAAFPRVAVITATHLFVHCKRFLMFYECARLFAARLLHVLL